MDANDLTPNPADASRRDPAGSEETTEKALQLLRWHMRQPDKKPLVLFPKTRADMERLAARLQDVNTPAEGSAVISELEKYLARSQVRHEALNTFIVRAWEKLEPLIEQAQLEYDSCDFNRYPAEIQMKISVLSRVWERLFQDFPFEMSYAYLEVGRHIRPLRDRYFHQFVRTVSEKLGRSVAGIVEEQIPSLG